MEMSVFLSFRKKVSLAEISMFLLIFTSNIVMVTSILFIVGLGINYLNLIIAFLLSVIIFLYKKSEIRFKIIEIGIALFILMGAVFVSTISYDHSWDGAAYHKTAVGLLKSGWNPIEMSAEEYNLVSKDNIYVHPNPIKWAESYPKASWYYAGTVYYLTNNIESGKSYTLIFMFILFGLLYEYSRFKTKKRGIAFFVALVGACHPTALFQMQSYYLDGLAGCILLALMIQLLALWEPNYSRRKEELYLSIFFLIVLGCNLKFSITCFVAVICILYFFMYVWEYRREKAKCLQVFCFFGLSASFSGFIIGMSPYLTNLVRYGDMLAGFSGMFDEKELEMQFGIEGLNRTGRAVASLFGKMSHGSYKSLQELIKLPFTFTKEEFVYYSFQDLKVSGFGFLFSGIFLVSLIILIIYVKKYLMHSASEKLITLFLFSTLLEWLFLQGTYQFRYVPHLYGIVPLAIILFYKSMYNKRTQLLFSIFAVLVVANCVPWFKIGYENIRTGLAYTQELKSMEDYNGTKRLEVAFWETSFSGIHYNLRDFGIQNYDFVDKSELMEDSQIKAIMGFWIMYR